MSDVDKLFIKVDLIHIQYGKFSEYDIICTLDYWLGEWLLAKNNCPSCGCHYDDLIADLDMEREK